jgi:undecaprenyl-diphosphatase
MISDSLEYLSKRSELDSDEPAVLKPSARALLFVLVGTIPLIVTLFFRKGVARLFLNTAFIGFALIVTGAILYVSDKHVKAGQKTEKTMTIGDAIIIGIAQAVAVIPGLSRSGTTIAVGLARGLSSNFAVRFSLLLSIPAVAGATLVTLYEAIRTGIDLALFPTYLAGFVIAAVVGFFAIQLIRRLMAKGGLGKFSYYCWGVGALAIILSLVIPGNNG